MITADGFLDWAERADPGYAIDKVNGWNNDARMYIPHSAVGYWSGYAGRIINTPKDNPKARASTHGFIAYDGTVKQILPLNAQCWASGSTFPNNHGIAFENEGGFTPVDEPLTPEQVAANVRIVRELMDWKGWTPRRPVDDYDVTATLYEHNECTRWGSAATACPSDRIPWAEILRRLEDDMSAEAKAALLEGKALKQLFFSVSNDVRVFRRPDQDDWTNLVFTLADGQTVVGGVKVPTKAPWLDGIPEE